MSDLTPDEENWIKKRGQENLDGLARVIQSGALKAVFAINCWHHVITFENS